MRGISHKELLKIDPWKYDNQQDLLNHIIEQCQEPNPWMTLEEFLKSGYKGWCWICLKGYPLTHARFSDGEFDKDDVLVNDKLITRVQPIHKPEPPQDD